RLGRDVRELVRMRVTMIAAILLAASTPSGSEGTAQGAAPGVLDGQAAYGDWRGDAPGIRRHLSPDALPPPYASRSSSNAADVVRFPYRNGDLKARGKPETVVARLPGGGHWTRDLAVSPDGRRLFVAVGSASNVAQNLSPRSPDEIRAWEAANGLGAAWGGDN